MLAGGREPNCGRQSSGEKCRFVGQGMEGADRVDFGLYMGFGRAGKEVYGGTKLGKGKEKRVCLKFEALVGVEETSVGGGGRMKECHKGRPARTTLSGRPQVESNFLSGVRRGCGTCLMHARQRQGRRSGELANWGGCVRAGGRGGGNQRKEDGDSQARSSFKIWRLPKERETGHGEFDIWGR